MKELQRLQAQKKQQMMMKKPSAPAKMNYNGGLMSLDEMKLDNRDNFTDEFDPFALGGTSDANSIKLKEQKKYMTGVKMSITEEEMRA